MMHVRDLRGEDLAGLSAVVARAATRFLVEAGEVIAAAGDGDVVVVGDGHQVYAAAAAGYVAPFGVARLVTTRGRSDAGILRGLLAHLESRAVRMRCDGVAGAVDARDDGARRTFETRGYTVTGAGVVSWTEEPGAGAPVRYSDVWWMRRSVALSEKEGVLLPAEDVAPLDAGNPARDAAPVTVPAAVVSTAAAPREGPCSSD